MQYTTTTYSSTDIKKSLGFFVIMVFTKSFNSNTPFYLAFRRNGWNAHRIEMENQIIEDKNALARKEQYIKNQEFLINSLTMDKQKSEECRMQEAENYQSQIEKLTADIADIKNTLVVNEVLYNKEISEMRYLFEYIHELS